MSEFGSQASPPALPFAPLSLSQALDRIWKILRGQIRLFLQLGSIPAAVMLLMYAAIFGGLYAIGILPPHQETPPDPARVNWSIAPVLVLAYLPVLLAYAMFEAAACSIALAANRGETSSFREAYGSAWRNAGRVVWLMILRWLCVAAPILAVLGTIGGAGALVILGGGRNLNSGILFVLAPFLMLAYVGGIVYAVWMLLRLGLALSACLAEKLTAVQALRRSAQMTRGAKGRMFLVMLVVYAIVAATFLVLEMVGLAGFGIVALIASAFHLHLGQIWMEVSVGILAVAAMAAFLLMVTLSWASYVIAFSVLYDDRRLRFEGAKPQASRGLA